MPPRTTSAPRRSSSSGRWMRCSCERASNSVNADLRLLITLERRGTAAGYTCRCKVRQHPVLDRSRLQQLVPDLLGLLAGLLGAPPTPNFAVLHNGVSAT